MNNTEIIKALECCSNEVTTRHNCSVCPLSGKRDCMTLLYRVSHDLINRQKAEVEKLSADIKTFENVIKRCFLQATGVDIDPFAEIKAEAYKEFAERLKKEAVTKCNWDECVDVEQIDNLVEELVGELQ